ncbi:hypothetical protein ABZ747_29215 [Kitasatospora cineracea]|uniref:hypothetical protein n=1 Tax=Kitasatospora cineracea TaxID=88074 RepID=UPI003408B69A
MSGSALPSPRSFFLTLAAEHIPAGCGGRQEFDDAGELTAMHWEPPPYVDEATIRRVLAALRRSGWAFRQEVGGQQGDRVLRLSTSTAAVEFDDTPGSRVDALLWQAGFDRYRRWVPVWGYRWDHLFDAPDSAYITVHGPGNGSHADARHRRELTDAMVQTVEAAEGWRTLRPECLDHAFHALPPAH